MMLMQTVKLANIWGVVEDGCARLWVGYRSVLVERITVLGCATLSIVARGVRSEEYRKTRKRRRQETGAKEGRDEEAATLCRQWSQDLPGLSQAAKSGGGARLERKFQGDNGQERLGSKGRRVLPGKVGPLPSVESRALCCVEQQSNIKQLKRQARRAKRLIQERANGPKWPLDCA